MTPNQITSIRIALLPLIAFFYLASFIPYGKLVAVILFVIAAVTDFIDGKLARAKNQVTDLGKFLDTIADKLLITVGLLLIVADGTIFAPWGVVIAMIIICREFLVTFLRQVAVNKGVVLAADKWGKYKAFFQDIAIPVFMLYAFLAQYGIIIGIPEIIYLYFAYFILFTATLLTIISGANYFIQNHNVFKNTPPNKE